MNVPIEAVAIIGKKNNPIFTKKFKADQETNLKYDFIANCCCDIIQDQGKDLYHGLLCSMEDIACYGYSTNTKLKFILMLTMQDKTIRDTQVKQLFTKVHDEYIKMQLNPFYSNDDQVSQGFITAIENLG